MTAKSKRIHNDEKGVYLRSVRRGYPRYLLRFYDPLEVVSDEWLSRNGIDSLIVDDEMSHLLWSLQDRGDAEQCYDMEPESSDEDEAPSLSM